MSSEVERVPFWYWMRFRNPLNVFFINDSIFLYDHSISHSIYFDSNKFYSNSYSDCLIKSSLTIVYMLFTIFFCHSKFISIQFFFRLCSLWKYFLDIVHYLVNDHILNQSNLSSINFLILWKSTRTGRSNTTRENYGKNMFRDRFPPFWHFFSPISPFPPSPFLNYSVRNWKRKVGEKSGGKSDKMGEIDRRTCSLHRVERELSTCSPWPISLLKGGIFSRFSQKNVQFSSLSHFFVEFLKRKTPKLVVAYK